MKKLVVVLLAGFLLLLGGIYLFIPGTIVVDRSIDIKIAPQASARLMLQEKNWYRWWPQPKAGSHTGSNLVYDRSVFTIDEILYNGLRLGIRNRSDSFGTLLTIIPISNDSVKLNWIGFMNTGWDPFSRLKKYWQAEAIGDDMKGILSSMQSFLGKQENVYGMRITREVVKDTFLISTKEIFNEYPGPSAINKMIQTLKDYTRSKGGNEVSPPMLHVDQLGPNSYQAMVAIATNKEITGRDKIAFKRMIRGYMLVAEVKGGRATIDKAISEVENFINDYQRTSPAIPYELMVTDRVLERDSTKWVTKIYYPIVL